MRLFIFLDNELSLLQAAVKAHLGIYPVILKAQFSINRSRLDNSF